MDSKSGAAVTTGDWLFTNSGRGRAGDTGPVRIHSFNPNVWTPAVQRARDAWLTKNPRIHDLRHTCASWLIAAGRPLPAIHQHIGHESITTTVASTATSTVHPDTATPTPSPPCSPTTMNEVFRCTRNRFWSRF
jgi:integrase